MKTIFIPAYSNSEWDSVTHVKLVVTDGFLDKLQGIKKFIDENFKDDYDFNKISYWSNVDMEFVIMDDFSGDIIENYDGEYEYPEQRLDTYQVKYGKDGVQFTAYGKHTNEEFWCETIPYNYFSKLS